MIFNDSIGLQYMNVIYLTTYLILDIWIIFFFFSLYNYCVMNILLVNLLNSLLRLFP